MTLGNWTVCTAALLLSFTACTVSLIRAAKPAEKNVITITYTMEVPDDPEIYLDGNKITFRQFNNLDPKKVAVDDLRTTRGVLKLLTLESVKPKK
jgi:hypothetical protein